MDDDVGAWRQRHSAWQLHAAETTTVNRHSSCTRARNSTCESLPYPLCACNASIAAADGAVASSWRRAAACRHAEKVSECVDDEHGEECTHVQRHSRHVWSLHAPTTASLPRNGTNVPRCESSISLDVLSYLFRRNTRSSNAARASTSASSLRCCPVKNRRRHSSCARHTVLILREFGRWISLIIQQLSNGY